MAVAADWDSVEKVLTRMARYRLYDTTLREMRLVIDSMKANGEFDDADPSMTLYGFFLSKGRTGRFVIVSWDDERGFRLAMGKPSPEEYWGEVFASDEKELFRILHEYLKET